MIKKIFYGGSGHSDLIAFHRAWKDKVHFPGEVSVTFASQILDFCQDVGAAISMTSVHADGRRIEDGNVVIEHRPKRPAKGLAYHLEELRYGLGLLKTAREFGADVALLDSGVTHYFWMSVFPLFGIPVVPILHNTLWPHGYPPQGAVQSVIQRLNAMFWRRTPLAGIAVSPEAERQVHELSPKHRTPMFQIRAQFPPDFFADVPAPPPHGEGPFQVMFIGRVHREKGVLDIPHMAKRVEAKRPGLVRWVICGGGQELDELKQIVKELDVAHVVDVKGWVTLEELQSVLAGSHASIVPTRSLFAEGLAMTAAEAILAGRVLVSNPVVPALEILQPAAVAANTNDPDSHADAVLRIAEDKDLYERLRANTGPLGAQFYDRSVGLTAVLHKALQPLV